MDWTKHWSRRRLVVLAEILANKSVPCRSASFAFCLVYLHWPSDVWYVHLYKNRSDKKKYWIAFYALCGVGKGWGGRGLFESIFAGYVPLASSQNRCAIKVYFWSILWPFIDPFLVIFGHYGLFLAYFLAYNEPHLSYFWANGFLL